MVPELAGLFASMEGTTPYRLLVGHLNTGAPVIAMTRFASAEMVTKLILKTLPVVITAKLTSPLNSRIAVGRSGAEALVPGECMVKYKRKFRVFSLGQASVFGPSETSRN